MFLKKRCRCVLKSKNRIGQRPIARYKKRSCGPPSEIPDESVKKGNGRDILKQTSYGKLFQVSMQLLEEYCSNSTLHGVRYFVDKKRHWLERFWWIAGFLMSIFCCGALIHKVYDNWDQRSIIVSISEELSSVWDIPLPAVTICPSNKIQYKDFNITEFYERWRKHPEILFNITDEEAKTLLADRIVCNPFADMMGDFSKKFTTNSLMDWLWKFAPSLNYTIMNCWLGGYTSLVDHDLECELEEIMTEQGLCFTFNMLNGKETYSIENTAYSKMDHNKTAQWNLDSGYDPNIDMNSGPYPYRAAGSVGKFELWIWMRQPRDPYLESCGPPSFLIALHLPGEIPQRFQFKLFLRSGEAVELIVKPKVITTSDGLRSYHPNKRKCYFNADRKLRFLKPYTQGNCELECLSNFTLSLCGCVSHYMLRDVNTPICQVAEYDCILIAQNKLVNGQIKRGLNITKEENAMLNKLVENCNCLPSCNSIKYDAEIHRFEIDKRLTNNDTDQLSTLGIVFDETKFMSYKRSEVYGIIDFIANCGGLLGLFVGASFLSGVELLYYCSLRLYCTRLNRKRENKITISFIN